MLIISPSAGRETQIPAVKLSGQMKFYLTFDFLFIGVLYPMFKDNYLLDPMLYNLLRKILMYYFITLSWGRSQFFCNFAIISLRCRKQTRVLMIDVNPSFDPSFPGH